MSETVVNLERARHILGGSRRCACGSPAGCAECKGSGTVATPLGRSYMTALKRAMRIKGRYFFIEDMRKWLRLHPDFGCPVGEGSAETYRQLLAEAAPYVEQAGQASLLDRIERKLAA